MAQPSDLYPYARKNSHMGTKINFKKNFKKMKVQREKNFDQKRKKSSKRHGNLIKHKKQRSLYKTSVNLFLYQNFFLKNDKCSLTSS